jgi:hypothetical protein
MRRRFIVEAEPVAAMTDQMNAGDQRGRCGRLRFAARPLPAGIVGRMRFIERERMKDVGQKQLLVLLLMIEPDLDDGDERLEIVGGFDESRHRAVNMGAVRDDFGCRRPRDHTALRARLPWSRRDVIRVVEIGKALIERQVTGGKRAQQKLLEEPGHMGAVPLGRARVGH